MGALEIYVLNVGQADTAVIKTPGNKIIVIDAVKPAKVRHLLEHVLKNTEIHDLVITHPHNDHYLAVPGLLENCTVKRVTLAPFWYEAGKPAYHTIINNIHAKKIPVRFVSGYERIYPDGGKHPRYEGKPCLELLGPPNNILQDLEDSNQVTPNHLSIISRLTYGAFNMVFAADAQMENWAHYDREGMLEKRCSVLKAAHHGSKMGNQWERIERLSPKLVIVSSDPSKGHKLPDLIGSVIFLEYDRKRYQKVALTTDTGTIKILVKDTDTRRYKATVFKDSAYENIALYKEAPVPETDWSAIVTAKIAGGH